MSASQQPKGKIFVSYSRRDAVWLERLRPFLEDLRRDGSIDYFDDSQISAGTDWRAALAEAVNAATVAILLVSQDYLASRFIRENELPPLLDAAEERGCQILPVIISPCRFRETTSISRFQAVNDPDKPLTRRGGHYREVFVQLVREIEAHQAAIGTSPTKPDDPGQFDIYLSIPMSSLSGDEYVRLRAVAERLVSAFQTCGFHVYCGALLVENPRRYSVPRTAVRAWQILDQSRYFVMIYPVAGPSSVLVEAGYALKQGIPSVYIVKQGVNLPYMLDISNKLEQVDIRDYVDLQEIEEMILNNCSDFFADPVERDRRTSAHHRK